MTIKKKVENHASVDAFISKGGKPANQKGGQRQINILIRFDGELLERINLKAKENKWMSRNAWINSTLENCLDQMEKT